VSTLGVAILGSTGSIGTTALRVLERQRDRFHVAALTAFTNGPLLAEQAERFRPGFVGLVKNGATDRSGWSEGERCLVEAATRDDVDIVLELHRKLTPLQALPLIEELGERLRAAVPPQPETTIVHGDFTPNNLLLRPGGEVAAMLDWELWTLGDPIADLAWLRIWWPPDAERAPLGEPPPSSADGAPPADHDVSVVSGTAMAAALTDEGFPVEQVLIDLDDEQRRLVWSIVDGPYRCRDAHDALDVALKG